jgi:hypothetical protein
MEFSMNYKDKRKQEMYDWFHQRFMEPESVKPDVNGVNKSRHSCGETYCAGEVVRSNFSGTFPDETIEEVVKDLESERQKWVMRKFEAPHVSF